MTWLKKIGLIALKIVGVASGIMPLVESVTPSSQTAQTVEDDLAKAFNVIVTADQMFAASSNGQSGLGPQKLLAATPFIARIVQKTPLLAGKKPKDEAKFEAATKALTSSLADVMNSYGE